MSNKILFTGGGSAGHVTLNLTLIPHFQEQGWETIYVGSKNGIEVDLVSKQENVKYIGIETGKLRRYFSIQNFFDLFKIPVGIMQAYCVIRKEKPDVIFSKGGFVSFPVIVGAWLNGKKAIMHESDMSLGLANRLSLPYVYKLFTTFEETTTKQEYKSKIDNIGPVMSARLAGGSKANGKKFCGFKSNKPVILVIGGSLGADSINKAIRDNLEDLLEDYQIAHVCGKGRMDKSIKQEGYVQFEYVGPEFKDLMTLSDIVISRAGSNSIFELLMLKKPMMLVPLPSTSSRGEQVLNAQSMAKKGVANVVRDEDLVDSREFMRSVNKTFLNRDELISNIENSGLKVTSSLELVNKIKEVLNDV
jgi:UDP-N-acetylglucosamine--N-acetylmuramyl-(pentapeptide) pyrophosphoryl-undecaprenol N-acetylglucosamine transferase